MKQLLKYLGYTTLITGTVAVIYQIGYQTYHLSMSDHSLGMILGLLFLGCFMVFLLVIAGLLCWSLLESMVGDPKSASYKAAEKSGELND